MGAAGEIMPLAHAFGPVAGIGQVIGPGGTLLTAAQALRARGLDEFSLGPKEGIALIEGVPGTTGLCALRLGEAAALASLMEACAALSIVVARAPRDPYDAACGRGDDLLAGVLGRLRASGRRRAGAALAAGPAVVPGGRARPHPGAAGCRPARGGRAPRPGGGDRLPRLPGRAVHRDRRVPRNRPGRALRPAHRGVLPRGGGGGGPRPPAAGPPGHRTARAAGPPPRPRGRDVAGAQARHRGGTRRPAPGDARPRSA